MLRRLLVLSLTVCAAVGNGGSSQALSSTTASTTTTTTKAIEATTISPPPVNNDINFKHHQKQQWCGRCYRWRQRQRQRRRWHRGQRRRCWQWGYCCRHDDDANRNNSCNNPPFATHENRYLSYSCRIDNNHPNHPNHHRRHSYKYRATCCREHDLECKQCWRRYSYTFKFYRTN